MDCITALVGFIERHRPCSRIIGDAGEVTDEGYLVWLECSCGGRLDRRVTAKAAEDEVLLRVTGSMN